MSEEVEWEREGWRRRRVECVFLLDVKKRKRERIDSDKWIGKRVECKEGSMSGKEREGVRRGEEERERAR